MLRISGHPGRIDSAWTTRIVYYVAMPFPEELPIYRILTEQCDVITSSLESLAVQVSWSGAKLVAPSTDHVAVDTLIGALANHRTGTLEDALATVTYNMFCFGNLALFCNRNGAVISWPAWWSLESDRYAPTPSDGTVIELKRQPLDQSGFGTPRLRDGFRQAIVYLRQQNAHMAALQRFIDEPAGPLPLGAAADKYAMDTFFEAIGFDPWDGRDLARLRNPSVLKAEVADLFGDLLARYAAAVRLTQVPRLIP